MAKRITDTQIELMRTAFNEGKDIPTCAMIANTFVSTAKKYLATEIQELIDNKTAIDRLSIAEFKQYVETEFNSIGKLMTRL